jgi:hypothetical protein
MSNFETHPKKLKDELLNSIHTSETALPDFQRDFVWLPSQTLALIISLTKRFPAGTLLRLESSNPMFQARAFAGAPELNGHRPKYLVLDGQQRLSSLYQALYGTGEHLYYVSIKKLLAGEDIEDSIAFYRREVGESYYGTIEKQAKWGILPLHVIFGDEGFYNWLFKVKSSIASLEQQGKQIGFSSDDATINQLMALYNLHVEPVVSYEFPVVTLKDGITIEAVCTIFETLNNSGVRLSVFDLLAARYFAQEVNLRQLWADALENTRYLRKFDIDPYYLLQSICVEARNSIKRSDILQLDPEIAKRCWDDAIWGMDEALDLLHEECGVLKPELLSYNTILVPLAASFMIHRQLKGPDLGRLRNCLKQWYWCSVFSQTYESGPTSQTLTDYKEIKVWIGGGEPPQTVRDFKFDLSRLYTTTTRQRAIYRGVLCLILQHHPNDFHSARPITSGLIEENGIDDHHIFPNAFLNATTTYPQAEIDAIVNRTMIDSETNKRIGKNPPSKYLDKIASAWGNPAILDQVLSSHQLPTGEKSSLRRDDFESFRNERAETLYRLIIDATSLDS